MLLQSWAIWNVYKLEATHICFIPFISFKIDSARSPEWTLLPTDDFLRFVQAGWRQTETAERGKWVSDRI